MGDCVTTGAAPGEDVDGAHACVAIFGGGVDKVGSCVGDCTAVTNGKDSDVVSKVSFGKLITVIVCESAGCLKDGEVACSVTSCDGKC